MEVNGYHQLFSFQHSLKYLLLCSTEETNSLKFGTWGRENFDNIHFWVHYPLNIQETSRDKIIRTAQQEREIRLSLWPSCVCSEALFPSAPERSSRDYTRTLSSPVWYRLLDTQNTLQRAQMVQRSRHKYRSAIYANGNYKYIYKRNVCKWKEPEDYWI